MTLVSYGTLAGIRDYARDSCSAGSLAEFLVLLI